MVPCLVTHFAGFWLTCSLCSASLNLRFPKSRIPHSLPSYKDELLGVSPEKKKNTFFPPPTNLPKACVSLLSRVPHSHILSQDISEPRVATYYSMSLCSIQPDLTLYFRASLSITGPFQYFGEALNYVRLCENFLCLFI